METGLSVVELQELDEVKGLLAKGTAGWCPLLYGDHQGDVGARPSNEFRRRRAARVSSERSEIELVEDIDPAIAAFGRRSSAPRPNKRGAPQSQKPALDLKPDMTTDSLQLFLKDNRQGPPPDRPGGGSDLAKAHRAGATSTPSKKMVESKPQARGVDRQELPQPGALPFLDLIQEGHAWAS